MPPFDLIDPDDAVYAELSGRFAGYNAARSTWAPRTFCIVHRDRGRIAAGGRGIVNMGALEVRGLWVDADLRGDGIGAQLLKAIEDEARRRGARRAMLYTFSWQAQEFYERAGYRVYGRFDFPDGPYRVDMQKDL